MTGIDALTVFLRSCAAIDLDEQGRSRLMAATSHVGDWRQLADLAEGHGLAPLVRRHVGAAAITLPQAVGAQLGALTIRHHEAGHVRAEALLDVARALTDAGVEYIVLKGAALAHDIYPSVALRPSRDLDILVAPGAIPRTLSLLHDLGFRPAVGALPWAHHHRPGVARIQGGYRVTVEVHEDAMSYDQPGRLTLATMTSAPRVFTVAGQTLFAFGHIDTLRHLTAHLLEPRRDTRLVGVVDLVGYAAHYAAEIDWQRIARLYPRVTNALRLMDYLHPLPSGLEFLRSARGSSPPSGVGFGLPPLSSVAPRGGPDTVSIGSLLFPSEWWMRAYYAVPEARPLAPTRWLRHAPRIGYWGLRRLLAWPLRGAAFGRVRPARVLRDGTVPR